MLFMRHERELLAFARMLLPTWNAVDDVLQEASLVMWRKVDQLEQDNEFLPWAKVIVRFEALKQMRRFSRDRLVLDGSLLNLLADEEMAGDNSVVESEKKALQLCLEQFSAEHRKLLLAPHSGGTKVKEMAEAIGKTPNSLYKILGRLRCKLHDCVLGRLAPIVK